MCFHRLQRCGGHFDEDDKMAAVRKSLEGTPTFQQVGIDLTNIIKDLALSDNEDLIAASLDKLKSSLERDNYDGLSNVLEKLKAELDKDIARRVYAGKQGAYETLLKLMKNCNNDAAVLKLSLKTVTSLMSGNPDLLDSDGVALQMEILDRELDVSIIQLLLRWIKECCLKHELNRQNIFNAGVLPKLKKILTRQGVTGPELRDACGVIRTLVLDDDLRHEFGKAHEHATQIARDSLDVLTELLSKFKDDKAVIGDLMLTLASLIVRNEFCQNVQDAGGVQFILEVMIDHPDSEKLNWQSLKLLKALAGNDNVKSHIVTSGSAPLIVSVMSRFKSSETIVAAGFACISALTLKSPSNAGVFYDCGAPAVIVDAMKQYPKSTNVLRLGSWAVRNMSVRNTMESRAFVQHGIESLLTDGLKIQDVELAADLKAALRDLGLKVEFKERWSGKGVTMRND